MNIRQLHIALLLFLVTSCANSTHKSEFSDADSVFKPSYARGFEIAYYGHSSLVTVTNPWQGAEGVEERIFLSRNGESAPEGFDGLVLNAPLTKVVCMSSSYVAFLDKLNELSTIKGISGVRYVNNPTIAAAYENGDVRDVGADSGVNYELLTALAPDVVFVYGVGGESSVVTNKISELDVPMAYVGDYLESTALGKAEWMIFFGEFFDKTAQARQEFDAIAKRYNDAKALAASVESRPKVMLNAPWRDVWFVPSDSTYMVALIEDAGGSYACKGEPGDRSRPLSGEIAYTFLEKSDYWLNPNSAKTLAQLKADNQKFAASKIVRKGRVFNNNGRDTEAGGSDFWESGVVMPDTILLDLIRILHPELLPDYQLYFYRELQ